MVNNRAKCLAISQVIRAKLYNSDLLFDFRKVFLLLRDTMSFFLFPIPPYVYFCLGPQMPMVSYPPY
jgi:hypothetical protein